MNEVQFAAGIRLLLNQGTQLEPRIANRLKAARQLALSRQRAERAPVLVWADNVFGSGWGWGALSARVVLPVVMLALTMAAGVGAQPNAPQSAKKDKPKATAVKKGVRPVWAELTAEQQAVLAPLKNDWDTLEPERRQKWIQIAKSHP